MNCNKKTPNKMMLSFFKQTTGSLMQGKTLAAITVFLNALTVSHPVYAAGGLARVTSTVNNVQTFLQGLALAVVTIALMWAGYKWLFKHATIDSLMPVIGGGILIGGAVEFASFLVG
jgi:type IV secretion system protein VirB2/type IV secretion system protein PtlA